MRRIVPPDRSETGLPAGSDAADDLRIGAARAGLRIGPILLAPGVTRAHVFSFLFVHALLMCLTSFIGMLQPYVLTEVLHIERSSQGSITGALVSTQITAVMASLLFFGVFADRFGRRVFMIIASAIMTLTLMLYPLASAVIFLFVCRFLFGLGSAAHLAGSNAMRMDLVDNGSRGRFSTLTSLSIVSLTTLFVSFLGARMPNWLVASGMSAADAGRCTFWMAAVLGCAALAVAFACLRRDRPTDVHVAGGGVAYIVQSLRDVYAHARSSRRFRLLLMMAPIVRCDSMILSTFLSLWILTSAADQGIGSAQAMTTVSTVAVIMSVSDVSASVLFGFVADAVDRLKMVVCCIALTGFAFMAPWWVTDVTGYSILAVIALIAMVEGATTVAGLAFIGEETPPHLRGATSSVFSWTGQASALIVGLVGGFLFDKVGHTAPFLLVSALALIWLAVASALFLRVRRSVRGPGQTF